MSKMYPRPEDPRSSSENNKRRNPQARDYMAAMTAKMTGDKGLGGGRSYERAMFVSKKAIALKEAGHEKEAMLLNNAMDVSIRGAYEIVRLPEEAFFALCTMVEDGLAGGLLTARRFFRELSSQGQIDGISAEQPVKVLRCKNNMYRITSLHNHSSVLISAHDMLYLGELVQYLMPELQEKAGEDPRSSEE